VKSFREACHIKVRHIVDGEPEEKNSKANPIETGGRSGGVGEICSVEVDEK
jgi:hypothetical protein